ncbi:UNVERIFIED_CONTAM: hypothetical protein FKN15_050823 [Acipenser sinensis]
MLSSGLRTPIRISRPAVSDLSSSNYSCYVFRIGVATSCLKEHSPHLIKSLGRWTSGAAAGRGQQSSNNRLFVMAVTRRGLPVLNEWASRDPTDGQSGAGRQPRL